MKFVIEFIIFSLIIIVDGFPVSEDSVSFETRDISNFFNWNWLSSNKNQAESSTLDIASSSEKERASLEPPEDSKQNKQEDIKKDTTTPEKENRENASLSEVIQTKNEALELPNGIKAEPFKEVLDTLTDEISDASNEEKKEIADAVKIIFKKACHWVDLGIKGTFSRKTNVRCFEGSSIFSLFFPFLFGWFGSMYQSAKAPPAALGSWGTAGLTNLINSLPGGSQTFLRYFNNAPVKETILASTNGAGSNNRILLDGGTKDQNTIVIGNRPSSRNDLTIIDGTTPSSSRINVLDERNGQVPNNSASDKIFVIDGSSPRQETRIQGNPTSDTQVVVLNGNPSTDNIQLSPRPSSNREVYILGADGKPKDTSSSDRTIINGNGGSIPLTNPKSSSNTEVYIIGADGNPKDISSTNRTFINGNGGNIPQDNNTINQLTKYLEDISPGLGNQFKTYIIDHYGNNVINDDILRKIQKEFTDNPSRFSQVNGSSTFDHGDLNDIIQRIVKVIGSDPRGVTQVRSVNGNQDLETVLNSILRRTNGNSLGSQVVHL